MTHVAREVQADPIMSVADGGIMKSEESRLQAISVVEISEWRTKLTRERGLRREVSNSSDASNSSSAMNATGLTTSFVAASFESEG